MLKVEEIRDLVTCKFTYKKLIGYCASVSGACGHDLRSSLHNFLLKIEKYNELLLCFSILALARNRALFICSVYKYTICSSEERRGEPQQSRDSRHTLPPHPDSLWTVYKLRSTGHAFAYVTWQQCPTYERQMMALQYHTL